MSVLMQRCLDCPQLVRGKSRCADCGRRHENGRSARRGASGWARQRTNAFVLGACPFLPPHAGRLVVDHIVPLADGGPDARANKRRVCELHHGQLTAAWRRGRGDQKSGA